MPEERFTIQTESTVVDGKYSCLKVHIFDNGVEIGDYIRMYHGMYNTFCPFEQDGEWFALYSEDYTATSVMRLPSCEKIAGEESDSFGFCPVDFYVPYGPNFVDEIDEDPRLSTIREHINGRIGFVAGCIWGDDCSWKIQHLDLSRIKEGIINRDERYGYIEMPRNRENKDIVRLKDIINLDWYDANDYPWVDISVAQRFKLLTPEEFEAIRPKLHIGK